MDHQFYLPCQPDWLCKPFMTVFTLLLVIGLLAFIRIVYQEYLSIQNRDKVGRLRRLRRMSQRQRDRLRARKKRPKRGAGG
ncbi:hypothetical protein [Vibrio sp. CAU 1672]|uniref:hypothetical protein n=1 Tax=Vibrio sp. CAU 1672 TaxID=3032594 RepID=UPI0023D9932C|nr:hypothetical protein [Vibrio sp. CAU 1672]MDF2152308.1 hypothetical protein [Vibrio sp. CAU 1672]